MPSFENATPEGYASRDATENVWVMEAAETSNGVDRVYSFTLSAPLPTTNILAPSFEKVTSLGNRSCDATENARVMEAAETPKVLAMAFPDASRTAPGSIVSSGAASTATAALCDGVRINDIALPSAAVSSSPAVRVIPPV